MCPEPCYYPETSGVVPVESAARLFRPAIVGGPGRNGNTIDALLLSFSLALFV